MIPIYENIPATSAPRITLIPNGRPTWLSLRANVWGTTQVNLQTYNANDTFPSKFWTIPASPVIQNIDLDLGFIGAGLLVYITVQSPDAVTTELLVNAFVDDCCDSSEREESSIIKHV